MRRLLLIAFHFPPFAGSSGVQRTLRFVQHLKRFGWDAIVLTSDPFAYEEIQLDLMRDIPDSTIVERAFALDTARHMAIAGRYPSCLARPDRWVTWWPCAVAVGRRMLRKYRPSAIFSTYPIATAHLIGHSLARASGLPWIADFRDPMAQEGFPADPRTWASYRQIEDRVFTTAAACTFTSPGAARYYRDRNPDSASRFEVIENGYDEESFVGAQENAIEAGPLNADALTILHSGIVYPDERNPSQTFAALALLKARGIDGRSLRVRFRAAVHEDLLVALAKRHGVEGMVESMPRLSYRDALREMFRADGLLVMQAANCNAQIPAKLYEYLRARRPVLALTDPAGDTAATLRSSGSDAIAPLDDATAIAELLERFVAGDRRSMVPAEAAIAGASRIARAEQLGRLIDVLCSDPRAVGAGPCANGELREVAER